MHEHNQRPNVLRRAVVLGVALGPLVARAQAAATTVNVWKTPSCGCCKDWVSYLQANGLNVVVHDVDDTSAIRQKNGIPAEYGSCHTAVVEGYALEGHVPVREIRRLLKERPKAAGLTVPGMPLGSPGMDGPEYDGRKHPYDVYLISRSGQAEVYQSYR